MLYGFFLSFVYVAVKAANTPKLSPITVSVEAKIPSASAASLPTNQSLPGSRASISSGTGIMHESLLCSLF